MKAKMKKFAVTASQYLMLAAVCGAFEWLAITQPIIYGH